VRNALILLAVVALLILVVGALNNGTAFDVDYVAGTASAVSLFWVSAVIAALVFVVGLGAAWFAQAAVAGSRRKLEAELQSTYERLREAEALVAQRPPVAAHADPVVVAAEPETATVVQTEAPTMGGGAAGPADDGEAVTVVDSGESATEGGDEAGTAAGEEIPEAEVAGGSAGGEQTAVTVTGVPAADGASAELREGESPDDGPGAGAADDQPGAPRS
jgi:hypothetical protein